MGSRENPREVIERIQEAKLETWKDLKERIDPWLRDRIAKTWGLKTGTPAS